MLADLDLFDLFRWTLGMVCTIYALVCTARTLWGWLVYFGSSRQTMVMGRYAAVLLLRIRVRRFAGELIQIALLLVVFGCLVYLHRLVL